MSEIDGTVIDGGGGGGGSMVPCKLCCYGLRIRVRIRELFRSSSESKSADFWRPSVTVLRRLFDKFMQPNLANLFHQNVPVSTQNATDAIFTYP